MDYQAMLDKLRGFDPPTPREMADILVAVIKRLQALEKDAEVGLGGPQSN